ncbi:MAG: ABC transporter ATP-binding protein [Anaerovoracaceae bacterium]|nr:ABC transporter ATP-binding protein [Anaerovoracaceae bacterium]
MAEQRRGPRARSGRGPAGMMPGEKAKNFKGTMLALWKYVKDFKWHITAVFIFAVGSTVFTIVSPKILGKATDKVVEGLMSGMGIDFDALLDIIIFLCAIYAASSLLSFLQGYVMSGVSQRITYRLRKEISEKMDRMPLKYFDTKTHGEILSRVTNDVETVNQSLNQSMTQIITSVTTVIGILVMMVSINIWMSLMAVIVIPMSALFIKAVVKKTQGYFQDQQRYLGDANGHVEEMYTGHQVVKAFNGEEAAIETFDEINEHLCESAWKSQFLSGLMHPISNLFGNIAYVLVCILGGIFAIGGRVSIGDIQAFIQYIRNFNQPIAQLANVANMLQSTAAAAERVFEFINEDEETEKTDLALLKTPDINQHRGNVTFDHVSFGYDPENIIINDFSAEIKQGQRVAIVGPTGAGKTTIVKLLMRFYELNSGHIYIDGTDITDYSREDLRKMFGMVLQDTWLYSGSIMDNIRYGRMDASDKEVRAAAKAANIDHFIRSQPKGYDTPVNEDAENISQGEKQLLTIARAILSDAPVMILDEATSSVDTRTEMLIQKAMGNLMQGRTSFIIAHRLSTIRDAEMILVMNHGDIVEQGTHSELLAAGGFYADLYNSQYA